jgi:uncharacterized protein YbgA (DUF1722 family)
LELLTLIEDYRQGLALQQACIIVRTLNRNPVPDWVLVPSAAWVHQQVYLHPYPKELMLRNHV